MIFNYRYNYNPKVYFLTTLLATYAFWFAGAYVSFQEEISHLVMLFMFAGGMAPAIVAVVMIGRSKNTALKKDFLHRLIDPRLIQWKMMPAILLIMPLSVLASVVLSIPLGESMSQFQFAEEFSFSSDFIPAMLMFLVIAVFEEVGWMGYGFDSLHSRYNLFTAVFIFGVLWSLWHVPLIFVNDSYQYQIIHQSPWLGVNFFVSLIPMGMIISWICIKNNRSVLAAILFHFFVNMCQEVLAISQTTKCIETAVLAVVAVVIVLSDKDLFFSKRKISYIGVVN